MSHEDAAGPSGDDEDEAEHESYGHDAHKLTTGLHNRNLFPLVLFPLL